jgi:hypothetical protein
VKKLHNFIDFCGKASKIQTELEKGNPLEKAGRKVTGLSLYGDRVAGLPGG